MINIEKEMAVASRETPVGVPVTAEPAADVIDTRHAHPAGVNSSARAAPESRPAPAGNTRPARVP